MKIFIDVDNTILEHSGFYSISTEERIHSTISNYPNENIEAIELMYQSSTCRNPDIVRELLALDDVYILTKYKSVEYEAFKQIRMASILGMSVQEMLNLKDKNGVRKYINLQYYESKVYTVFDLFGVDNLEGFLLLDDYSANIIEWQNYGGTGIKYYNQYNSANHPTLGLSISNFEFFKSFIDPKAFENLMIVCEDVFKLGFFSDVLINKTKLQPINLVDTIITDMKKRLDIEDYKINRKYDLKSSIFEYYNFMDNLIPDYWHNSFIKTVQPNIKHSLLYSSLNIDLRKINIADKSLALKIIDREKDSSPFVFDVYLTLDEGTIFQDAHLIVEEQVNLIKKYILGR